MKRTFLLFSLIFLIFFSFTSLLYAQTPIDECEIYLKAQDYQRAISAGQRAVKLYPSNYNAHLCLGVSYRQAGEIDYAINSLKNAEKYAYQKSDLMLIYNQLGLTYYRKGMLDDAFLYYNRALILAKNSGDRDSEAGFLNNIALIFRDKGELDKALSYYEESLKLTINENDKTPTYNNIASIYYQQGNYKKAVEYLRKAMDIDERYGDYHRYAIHELNLGNTYRKMTDFNSAEFYLFDGLKRIQKIGDKYWEGIAYKYLGLLYRDKGDKASARDYSNRALKIFKGIGAQADAQEVELFISQIQW